MFCRSSRTHATQSSLGKPQVSANLKSRQQLLSKWGLGLHNHLSLESADSRRRSRDRKPHNNQRYLSSLIVPQPSNFCFFFCELVHGVIISSSFSCFAITEHLRLLQSRATFSRILLWNRQECVNNIKFCILTLFYHRRSSTAASFSGIGENCNLQIVTSTLSYAVIFNVPLNSKTLGYTFIYKF